ncbi:hypothetical protein LCGC14_2871920, partial [marine sediment metagenome]
AVNAVQLSSEGVGQRILRRSVAVSTNIDTILPDLQAALREQARTGNADPVRVPDFPIPVDIARDDALSLEGTALRERILNESATRLYKHGMSAWADADDKGKQDIELVSTAGLLERGLGLLTAKNHDGMVIAAAVLGFLSVAFAVLLLASVRSWARLIALSAVTIAAALPSLGAAVAVRFGFRTAQEEADPFVSGLLDLGVEAMWLPIRNYLALTVLGFAVMLLTLVFIWASSRQGTGPVDSPAA